MHCRQYCGKIAFYAISSLVIHSQDSVMCKLIYRECHQKAINKVNESFQTYNREGIITHWLLSATPTAKAIYYCIYILSMYACEIHFQYCCKARDVRPQKSTGYFTPSVWVYWSSTKKIRWKPQENTICHIKQYEELTSAFMQTLYIQIEAAEATMRGRNFKSCIMHFAISHCLWARSMKTFTVRSTPIDHPMRQKAEGSKTQKKWIRGIRCNAVGRGYPFPIQWMVHLLSPWGWGWGRAKNMSY